MAWKDRWREIFVDPEAADAADPLAAAAHAHTAAAAAAAVDAPPSADYPMSSSSCVFAAVVKSIYRKHTIFDFFGIEMGCCGWQKPTTPHSSFFDFLESSGVVGANLHVCTVLRHRNNSFSLGAVNIFFFARYFIDIYLFAAAAKIHLF